MGDFGQSGLHFTVKICWRSMGTMVMQHNNFFGNLLQFVQETPIEMGRISVVVGEKEDTSSVMKIRGMWRRNGEHEEANVESGERWKVRESYCGIIQFCNFFYFVGCHSLFDVLMMIIIISTWGKGRGSYGSRNSIAERRFQYAIIHSERERVFMNLYGAQRVLCIFIVHHVTIMQNRRKTKHSTESIRESIMDEFCCSGQGASHEV